MPVVPAAHPPAGAGAPGGAAATSGDGTRNLMGRLALSTTAHRPGRMSVADPTIRTLGGDRPDAPEEPVPMKVGEILRLIEADHWYLVTVRGSHRRYKHPTKPGRNHHRGQGVRHVAPQDGAKHF